MDHWTENYCDEEKNFFKKKKVILLLYSRFLKKSVPFVNLVFYMSAAIYVLLY